jgi:hypothetical protein
MFSSSIEGRTAPTGRAPNLQGDKYGRLALVSEVAGQSCRPSVRRWLCQCDCGEVRQVKLDNLRSGHSTSCGCTTTTHGLGRHPLYPTHNTMMKRCYNPESGKFANYGARGIQVCERWHSVENFIADLSPSHQPGLSLERVDNNLGYSPENCVWATSEQQARNRRSNRLLSYQGRTICLAEACDISGLPYRRVNRRLGLGWSIPRALESSDFQEPLLESAQTPEPLCLNP